MMLTFNVYLQKTKRSGGVGDCDPCDASMLCVMYMSLMDKRRKTKHICAMNTSQVYTEVYGALVVRVCQTCVRCVYELLDDIGNCVIEFIG